MELPTFTVCRRMGLPYLCAMFVGNVVWETLHLPLYTLWANSTVAYLAFVVIHCTAGDLMIGGIALLGATAFVGRDSPVLNYSRLAGLTVVLGLTYTTFSEWLNVSVRGSWAYSAAMPVVPVLGTGLSPILQWMVVPITSFMWVWAARR